MHAEDIAFWRRSTNATEERRLIFVLMSSAPANQEKWNARQYVRGTPVLQADRARLRGFASLSIAPSVTSLNSAALP